MMLAVRGRLSERELRNQGRYYRGPIFHTRKPPNGKIVAQVLYASRLPSVMAGQDYLGRILLRVGALGAKKMCEILLSNSGLLGRQAEAGSGLKFGGFREAEIAFGQSQGEKFFDLGLLAVAGHRQFAHQEITRPFEHLLFAER
jgi:hypothetical protein